MITKVIKPFFLCVMLLCTAVSSTGFLIPQNELDRLGEVVTRFLQQTFHKVKTPSFSGSNFEINKFLFLSLAGSLRAAASDVDLAVTFVLGISGGRPQVSIAPGSCSSGTGEISLSVQNTSFDSIINHLLKIFSGTLKNALESRAKDMSNY
ncbi:unnamed protein product [Clavelina lepadiformis]|uniref:Uncharacterized protein n=1 Tax=Clavelina lepadiformis TaxID=159417 RepID=A0ABP0FSH1_CLALP